MADTEVSITFRTTAEVRDQLDHIARNMKRDRSYVIKEALDDYLRWMEYERQRSAAAREAIARGDANELVEVLDDLDREFFAADLTEREPEGARQTQRRG